MTQPNRTVSYTLRANTSGVPGLTRFYEALEKIQEVEGRIRAQGDVITALQQQVAPAVQAARTAAAADAQAAREATAAKKQAVNDYTAYQRAALREQEQAERAAQQAGAQRLRDAAATWKLNAQLSAQADRAAAQATRDAMRERQAAIDALRLDYARLRAALDGMTISEAEFNRRGDAMLTTLRQMGQDARFTARELKQLADLEGRVSREQNSLAGVLNPAGLSGNVAVGIRAALPEILRGLGQITALSPALGAASAQLGTIGQLFNSTGTAASFLGAGAGEAGAATAALGGAAGVAGLAVAGAGALIVAAGAGIASSVNAYAELEKAMNGLKASSGANAGEMKQLRGEAENVGRQFGFLTRDVVAAQEELSKGGVSVQDIAGGAATAVAVLAKATGVDFKQAVDIAVPVMNVWSLSGAQMMQVADAISNGANKSALDVAGLAQSLQQSANSAQASGLTLNETVAVLAALADRGMQGSDAGTSLKVMLQRLQAPTKDATAELKAHGVAVFDATGKQRNMIDVLGDVMTALDGMTDKQRSAFLATVFGSDATRAITSAWKTGSGTLREYIAAMGEQGTALNNAKTRTEGIRGAQDRFNSALDTFKTNVGELFAPAMTRIIDMGTAALDIFTRLTKAMNAAFNSASTSDMTLQGRQQALSGLLAQKQRLESDAKQAREQGWMTPHGEQELTGILTALNAAITELRGQIKVATDKAVQTGTTPLAPGVQGPNTGGVKGDPAQATVDSSSSEYQSRVAMQALQATGVKTADQVVDYCAQWVRLTLGKADAKVAPIINRLFQTDHNRDGTVTANDAAQNVRKAGLMREFKSTKDLMPGDVVFYEDAGAGHVGVYIGGGLVRGNNRVSMKETGNPVGNVAVNRLGTVTGFARAADFPAGTVTPGTPTTDTDPQRRSLKALQDEYLKLSAAYKSGKMDVDAYRNAVSGLRSEAEQLAATQATGSKEWTKTEQFVIKASAALKDHAAATKDAETAAATRLQTQRALTDALAQGREADARRLIDSLKAGQSKELELAQDSAKKRAAIVAATAPQIIAAEDRLAAAVRDRVIAAAKRTAEDAGKQPGADKAAIAAILKAATEEANKDYATAQGKARADQAAAVSTANRAAIQAQQAHDKERRALLHQAAEEARTLQVSAAQATMNRLQTLDRDALDRFKGSSAERLALIKKQAADEYEAGVALADAVQRVALERSAIEGGKNQAARDAQIRQARTDTVTGLGITRDATVRAETDAQAKAVKALRDQYHALAESVREQTAAGVFDEDAKQKAVAAFNALGRAAVAAGLETETHISGARKSVWGLVKAGQEAKFIFDQLGLGGAIIDPETGKGKLLYQTEQQVRGIGVAAQDGAVDFFDLGNAIGNVGLLSKTELEVLITQSGLAADEAERLRAAWEGVFREIDTGPQLPDNLQGRGVTNEPGVNDPARGVLAPGEKEALIARMDTMNLEEIGGIYADLILAGLEKSQLGQAIADYLRGQSDVIDQALQDVGGATLAMTDTGESRRGDRLANGVADGFVYQTDAEVRGQTPGSGSGEGSYGPSVDTIDLRQFPTLEALQATMKTAGYLDDDIKKVTASWRELNRAADDLAALNLTGQLTALDRLRAAGGVSEGEYIDQRKNLLVQQENARYQIDVRGKTGAALELAEQQHQANLGQIVQDGAAAALALQRKTADRVLSITQDANAAELELRRRAGMSEVQYLTEKQALDEQAARDDFAARVRGMKAGSPEYVAEELALQTTLTNIGRKGAADRAETTKTAAETLAGMQRELSQAQSGSKDTPWDAQIRAAEKFKVSAPEYAEDIDRIIAAFKRLQEKTADLEKFNRYADYIGQIAGQFAHLGDAVGGDLGANLNGFGKALQAGVDIAKDAVAGNWFGVAIKGISLLIDALGGFQKANAQAIEMQKDFNKQFTLIIGDNFAKTSVQSRGFFADLFGGGPKVVQDVDNLGLSIARAIEGGVTNGIKSGLKTAMMTGDWSGFRNTFRESAFAGVVDGIIESVFNEELKSIIGPGIKAMVDAAKTPDTSDDAAALAQFEGSLSAGEALLTGIGKAIQPSLDRLRTDLGLPQDTTDSGATAANSPVTGANFYVANSSKIDLFDSGITRWDAISTRIDAMYQRHEAILTTHGAAMIDHTSAMNAHTTAITRLLNSPGTSSTNIAGAFR